jgi:UDPglucose--hexose-1-phosphate uridylyltransferase
LRIEDGRFPIRNPQSALRNSMPEFRQDPITGRWVNFAEERAARPFDYGAETLPEAPGPCPFCAGEEHLTPREVLAVRRDSAEDGPGWQVRVVTNKYPAWSPLGALDGLNFDLPCADGDAQLGRQACLPHEFYRRQPAWGVHEVVIESPRHLTKITEVSNAELATVFCVYRDRLRMLRDEGRWRYGLVFKNHGAAAGASLAHIHSQLVALPVVPTHVQERLAGSWRFFERARRTVWSEIIRRERDARERTVMETKRFIAFCPWASRQPYELMILPTAAEHDFCEVSSAAAGELAELVRTLVAKLELVLKPASFNWMIHTCPFDSSPYDHYHWQIEIVPRVMRTAGYEWASGWAVNPVSPERAAATLREIEK